MMGPMIAMMGTPAPEEEASSSSPSGGGGAAAADAHEVGADGDRPQNFAIVKRILQSTAAARAVSVARACGARDGGARAGAGVAGGAHVGDVGPV